MPHDILAANFPPAKRLRKPAEYSWVFASAQRVTDKYFVVLFRPNDCSNSRLGLAIAKKHVGNMIMRNRVKRLLREFFRKQPALGIPMDIVILSRRALISTNNEIIRSSIKKLWLKLAQCCNT